MAWKHIKISRRNSVCQVTLQRGEAMNALNETMIKEIEAALSIVKALTTIRVLVLTGGDERAFSVGADINDLKEMTPEDFERWLVLNQEFFDTIANLRVPSIAALNGYALGGGLEMALACDIRIAKEGAKLGFPEAKLGVIPGTGGTQRLTRSLGAAVAKDLVLTGRIIEAEEALRLGLVSQVIPTDKWEDAVEDLAQKLVRRAPKALEAARRCIDAAAEVSMEEGLALERSLNVECFKTKDFQEGVAAFQEKRDPHFRGT